jgi:hypothetical protein
VRHLVTDAVEVVQAQLDISFAGDGEQVQHDVGRAAERHGQGDGVLECLFREDVARRDALAQQVHHRLPDRCA